MMPRWAVALTTVLRVLGVIFILTFASMAGVEFEGVVWWLGLVFTLLILGLTDAWFHRLVSVLKHRRR
jgi:hypothetical protein